MLNYGWKVSYWDFWMDWVNYGLEVCDGDLLWGVDVWLNYVWDCYRNVWVM